MTLSDLASIGSLVSGVAVLVSLLYLNVQVRQAAKHTRAGISHGFATRTVDFNYRMTDEALATVIAKGRKGTEELSEVEAYRFFSYCRAAFWNAADTAPAMPSGRNSTMAINSRPKYSIQALVNAPITSRAIRKAPALAPDSRDRAALVATLQHAIDALPASSRLRGAASA